MDPPTDIEELVAFLVSDGWKEDVAVSAQDVPIRLRRSDGFLFEACQERKVWKGRLDRGDGWRSLEDLASAPGIASSEEFDLPIAPGARSAALAYEAMPQHHSVQWKTLVPRCIEWLGAAPPAPTRPSNDILASLARRDFHHACIDIIDRRTHGLHLRPMPSAPALARQSPVELLRWLRRSEVHERIQWDRDHILRESARSDQPASIGGESQMLSVAYLDEPEASPDPEVVIHDHLHHDFIRGEPLASMPLSRYIFDCLVCNSDFHSAWTRPAGAARTESVLWSEDPSVPKAKRAPSFTMRVGATWMQLHGWFLVDDPVQASEELGETAQLHTLFEWGTRTVKSRLVALAPSATQWLEQQARSSPPLTIDKYRNPT